VFAKVPTEEQRQRLQVTPQEEVNIGESNSDAVAAFSRKRITVRAGPLDLGDEPADRDHDTPFGKAVQPLEPYRQTFAVKVLWSPLPDGWENHSITPSTPTNSALSIPDALFEHRAVLYNREHKPFSEVDEYTGGNSWHFRHHVEQALADRPTIPPPSDNRLRSAVVALSQRRR